MTNKIAVKVSGSIAALLFFEHANSPGDQEGFLLGEMVSRTTRTISDAHLSAEKEEISIHIYAILPCDMQAFSFYDSCGRLQEEKLNCYIKDRKKDVIGWYKFRRNTPLEISLRERAVHENLSQELKSPNLIFGIFTSCTRDTSTYTFDHIILRSTRLGFERSCLNIINLGTTSHAEYLHHPHDATNILAGSFSEVVNTVSVNSMASVNQVLEMHRELRLKMESVKEDVAVAEAVLGSMCVHVAELEDKFRFLQALKKRSNKMQKHDLEANKQSNVEPASYENEQLQVVHQDDPEQSQKNLQNGEQSAPVDENCSMSVDESPNAVEQREATCTNLDGGSTSEGDATT